MPTVPSLEQPGVQAEGLPGRAFPRVDDSVNPAAYGTPLAQGLENVSSAVTEEEAKQKIQNDNLRVIDANTQLEAGRNALLYGTPGQDGKMQGGAFSLHGMDAINLPAKLGPAYQQMAGKISAGLTPDQQRLFQGHIASGSNELNLQLNRYEYEESNRLANQVYTNGANQAVESASVGWRDPIVVGKSRADIKALVQLQGDREGWPQDERNAQTQKLLAEMHYSVVDRMLADGNPQAALRYFVGSKAEPGIRDSHELTGEQAHQLGAAIDQAIRQQGAQMQTAVASKVRDVRAAAINGQLVPPSSMPSDGELRAAYPDNWQEVKSGIQRDVQMGSDLKSFASLTPQELAAHVDSYKPTSVLGAAEGYDRYNAAAAAAQRTMADRAKDPRQYAIDNKLGSNALDFSDMQGTGNELRARLASTQQLSAQIGGYVPPLSRNEAAQLTQTFENQTPADRLRSLSALSASLDNDKGFQEIMRQVLPGSPVTAIVGAQVSASNPHEPPVWFDQHFAQSPTDQTRILAGEQLLNPQGSEKDKGKKPFPMPRDEGSAGLREQFASASGDLFRGRPELGEAYFQAFKGAYASLLSEKGDLSGNGNSTLMRQALKMVVGSQVSFHNGQISVPQGMDPSRFEGLVDKAVATRLTQYAAPPSPDTNFARNSAYASKPDGGYLTKLAAPDEAKFQQWVATNHVPYDSSSKADYDMRGFWKALQSGDKRATTAINANDHQIHFPDTWKTPYHQSFSADSQFATAGAPKWNARDQLVLPNGKVVFDERNPASRTDGLIDKIRGYQLRELGGLGSGRYELVNGNMPLMRPDGKGVFTVDVNSEYLPSRGAAGSPADQSRPPIAVKEEAGAIEGKSNVPKVTAADRAIKAPPLNASKGRGGRAHPSQGPEL